MTQAAQHSGPRLTLEELRSYARGRLGLIIGPGATTANGQFWDGLREAIAARFSVEPRGTFHETGELAAHQGATVDSLRELVAETASAAAAAPVLSQLSKIRWTAIISCALDDHLETRLEQEHLRRPARTDVTVLSNPDAVARPGVLPIYKILGSARRRDVAATTADVLRRGASLSPICREFLDLLKASPVLCAGMDGIPWLLNPLLAALYGPRGAGPAKFIVLSDDPLASNLTLLQLVPERSLLIATASLIDVAKAVEPIPTNQQTTLNFSGASGKTETLDLGDFTDLLTLVNSHLDPVIKSTERDRLLDYLFMPDLPNWDAIAHKFDFTRTLTETIVNDMALAVADAEQAVFLFHGRAASGKTTVLKRAAFELAQRGEIVCWMKDYLYGDIGHRLEKLLVRLERAKTPKGITFFLDAAVGGDDESFQALLRAAGRQRLSPRIVISTRTSRLPELERELRNNGIVAATTWELPDDLDDDEWSRLPGYLVRLGVAADLNAARLQVDRAGSEKRARDTLALLFWLLPQTQRGISRSVQEEYITLGDSKRLNAALLETFSAAPGTLRDAYAMVAVSTRYGAPLPIEILTHALGINYAQWLEAAGTNGPAWGLFYSADDSDAEGACYITRNDVVTDILLRTINGGVLEHTGEVGILARLLRACEGTNSVYEQYCERILVPHKNLQGLSLVDGVSLYTAAGEALPYKNRAILHHKALWIRRNGGDVDESLRILDEALATPPSPHGDRVEADEHLHTSKAAAILDKLEQRKISPDEGRQEVIRELEKSRSPNFINPHATHVYAGLVSRLAFGKGTLDDVDRYELLNRALSDLDRMILLVRSGGVRRRATGNDLEFLETRRNEIFEKCVDTDEDADRLWVEKKSQLGFVVATRRKLSSAIGSMDAGSTFNEAFVYWSAARDRVVNSGGEVTPELAEVGLVLYYSWQVYPRSRKRIRNVRAPIQWTLVKELVERTLTSKRFSRDPFYRFLHGLCLGHLGEWASADLAFDENRRLGLSPDVLHAPRAYLLHPEGTPWKLQGELKSGASSAYFDAVDIHRQFMATKRENWPKGSAALHAFVIFSFAGPKATRSEELCKDVDGRW